MLPPSACHRPSRLCSCSSRLSLRGFHHKFHTVFVSSWKRFPDIGVWCVSGAAVTRCLWAGCAHPTQAGWGRGGRQGEVYLRSPVWWANPTLTGKVGFPWFATWCSLLVGFVLQGIQPSQTTTTAVHGRRVAGRFFRCQGGRTDCDRSATFASPMARHFHWGQGHSCISAAGEAW